MKIVRAIISAIVGPRVGAVIALIGGVAATVAIYEFWSKRIELQCVMQERNYLTRYQDRKDFKARFEFQDKPVISLWEYKVSLINSGNRSIVASGRHSTLINDGELRIHVQEPYEIVSVGLAEQDVPSPVSSVIYGKKNALLVFSQWLKGERADLILYLHSESTGTVPVIYFNRDLAFDGEIIVVDGNRKLKKRYLDYLPNSLRAPLYLIAVLGNLMLVWVFSSMILSGAVFSVDAGNAAKIGIKFVTFLLIIITSLYSLAVILN